MSIDWFRKLRTPNKKRITSYHEIVTCIFCQPFERGCCCCHLWFISWRQIRDNLNTIDFEKKSLLGSSTWKFIKKKMNDKISSFNSSEEFWLSLSSDLKQFPRIWMQSISVNYFFVGLNNIVMENKHFLS